MLLANIVSKAVIVQFILYLLLTFNVVSMRNQFVSGLWEAINAVLAPLLRPIQRLMPPTGAIDFSPMVLIVLIQVLIYFLAYLQGVLA
ncbi:MAG: YggT family protein [Proteobacteria bacterium]|nr:YggT family protein [Pseudomonadota bacterium]